MTILSSALYLVGRYGEAAEASRHCVQRAPTQVNCWGLLAAALGQVGQQSEAKAAVDQLLRLSPGYTISEETRRRRQTYRDPAVVERLAEGLRKAGVPE